MRAGRRRKLNGKIGLLADELGALGAASKWPTLSLKIWRNNRDAVAAESPRCAPFHLRQARRFLGTRVSRRTRPARGSRPQAHQSDRAARSRGRRFERFPLISVGTIGPRCRAARRSAEENQSVLLAGATAPGGTKEAGKRSGPPARLARSGQKASSVRAWPQREPKFRPAASEHRIDASGPRAKTAATPERSYSDARISANRRHRDRQNRNETLTARRPAAIAWESAPWLAAPHPHDGTTAEARRRSRPTRKEKGRRSRALDGGRRDFSRPPARPLSDGPCSGHSADALARPATSAKHRRPSRSGQADYNLSPLTAWQKLSRPTRDGLIRKWSACRQHPGGRGSIELTRITDRMRQSFRTSNSLWIRGPAPAPSLTSWPALESLGGAHRPWAAATASAREPENMFAEWRSRSVQSVPCKVLEPKVAPLAKR